VAIILCIQCFLNVSINKKPFFVLQVVTYGKSKPVVRVKHGSPVQTKVGTGRKFWLTNNLYFGIINLNRFMPFLDILMSRLL
jgi:hypothetical protein